MTIRTDRRQITARPAPEAVRDAAELFAAHLDLQIRLARLLARIDTHASFVYESCTSIAEFGARHGADPYEARMLCNLGKALEAAPELEAAIRERRVPLRNAAAVGRILENPAYQRPGDDWIREAELRPTRALRKRVAERIEETRQAVPGVVEVSVFVTERAKERFDRARVLASRKKGRALTDGETFTTVTDHYLASFDPEEKGAAKRRVGPTAERPESRYVPAEVRRRLRARSRDACEVPGCPNRVFLQKSHRVAKAEGGGQEVEDLYDLCTNHHTLHDAGRLSPVGWTLDGRPIFRTQGGEVLWPPGALARPPPEPPGRTPPARAAPSREPAERPRPPPANGRVGERTVAYEGHVRPPITFST